MIFIWRNGFSFGVICFQILLNQIFFGLDGSFHNCSQYLWMCQLSHIQEARFDRFHMITETAAHLSSSETVSPSGEGKESPAHGICWSPLERAISPATMDDASKTGSWQSSRQAESKRCCKFSIHFSSACFCELWSDSGSDEACTLTTDDFDFFFFSFGFSWCACIDRFSTMVVSNSAEMSWIRKERKNVN